jgi:hypothetical protein
LPFLVGLARPKKAFLLQGWFIMAGYTVLPLGFETFEKSILDKFFNLASRRAPHWTLTTQLLSAKVVLVSANSQAQIDAVRSVVASWQRVILLGNSDYGTGWLTLPRPLNLNSVLVALNESTSARPHAAAAQKQVAELKNDMNLIAV